MGDSKLARQNNQNVCGLLLINIEHKRQHCEAAVLVLQEAILEHILLTTLVAVLCTNAMACCSDDIHLRGCAMCYGENHNSSSVSVGVGAGPSDHNQFVESSPATGLCKLRLASNSWIFLRFSLTHLRVQAESKLEYLFP